MSSATDATVRTRRRRRPWVAALFVTLGLTAPLLAQTGDLPAEQEPCVVPRMDQVDAAVRAKALRTGETLVFEYSLENRRGAAAAVARFAIEASRNANNQPLRQIAPV